MADALAEHDRRMGEAMADHGGYVFTTAGDSFAVAFSRPAAALAAAIGAQRRLLESAPGPRIAVRMALHVGTAYERDGDYFGPVVNRCARLMSAGHGAQILMSGATAALVREDLADHMELIDLGEHQLKDLLRPEHIYQVTHPSLQRDFPKLKTLDAEFSNLPVQLTSFVGRQQEIAEVSEHLSSSRLVTLSGAGGSGKTRLALQLAAESFDEQVGGVALAELASLADPELVADTVAAAFGAKAAPGGSLVEAIAERIGGRELLLVLDNCEHVVDAVGALVLRLLTLCPGVRILTTSQSPLGIPGEIVYRVPSLAVPESSSGLADAQQFDAVKLFSERAQLAKPSFELTGANADAVITICRQLDGIPLALELAAARVSILSPARIADRLGERFRLLAGGPRSVDPRHQTLQAAIDWSFDLLTEDEKALFRRCGIFAGSFDLEAIEVVGAGDPLAAPDVLDLLWELVQKSLVTIDDDGDDTRYRLLESIRQYALQRLDECGETEAVAIAHASFFADLAESLQRTYRQDKLPEALTGFREDRDNLRSALDFALRTDRLEHAGRVIGAIGYLWYADGDFPEGIDWCAQFFALEPRLEAALTASVLHSYGTLLGSWAEPEAGAGMLEKEVALRRELNDPVRLAAALNNLGTLWNDAGRREQGDDALLEAVALYRAAGESPSMSLNSLGWGCMNDGDYEGAMRFYRESLDEARQTGNHYDLALGAASIGQCATHLGDLAEARSALDEARDRFVDLGVTPGVQDADLVLALVDRAEGDERSAADRLARFLEDPDSHWYMAAKFWGLQLAASIAEDPELGAQLLGAAERHYGAVKGVQPAFVRADLAATRATLVECLGEETFTRQFATGAARQHSELLSEARLALTTRAAGLHGPGRAPDHEPDPERVRSERAP